VSTEKSDRGERRGGKGGKGGKGERVGFVVCLGKAGKHVDEMP